VLPFLLCVLLLGVSPASVAQKSVGISAQDYGALHFSGDLSWQTLWIDKEQRAQIEKILDHRFGPFRIRYWGQEQRTGWIFEEIGKELPITVAVVVEDGHIIDLTVLEYRESRGGEVVYPFFTGQFLSAKLKDGSKYGLDKTIDGITGATLSVWALKKVATLALYCHQLTEFSREGT
jgi:hypothetical protein